MCELFGISGASRVDVAPYLKEFFEHSHEHPDGWGFFNADTDEIIKEGVPAFESKAASALYAKPLPMISGFAHIRQATAGSMNYDNAHPFRKTDKQGKTWTLIHNGTIFDYPALDKYKVFQVGTTDSERILLYLLDVINSSSCSSFPELCKLLADTIREMTPKNKINLLFYDGEYMFVHTNMEGTLYFAELDGSTLFSTTKLSGATWTPLPLSKLMVYKSGHRIFEAPISGSLYVE